MDQVLYPLKGCTEPGTVVALARGRLASGTTGFTAATSTGKNAAWARTNVGLGTLTYTSPKGFCGELYVVLSLEKATAEALSIEVVSCATSSGTTTVSYRLFSPLDGTTLADPANAVIITCVFHAKDSTAI